MSLSVAPWFGPGHVYRIGVYGGPGSGKTSLLAALGLGEGRHHPDGFSCARQTRIPNCPPPAGEPASWTPEELRTDPVKAFYRGSDWIRMAENRMRCGQPLEQNPANIPPLLLVYDLTAPDLGRVTVEVTDFAGELINPNVEPSENAGVLARILETVDAVLVLAEAPYPDQDGRRVGEMLKAIEIAFYASTRGHVDGGKLRLPIAMLLNKWDRRGSAGATAGERAGEIDMLMSTSPSHQNLRSVFENVATGTAVFAVSAYGTHQTLIDERGRPIPGHDRPADFPLPSFGLEDPFVWACRTADANALMAARDSAPGRAAGLNPFGLATSWQTWGAGRTIARRAAAGSELRAGADRIAERGRNAFVGQLAITLVLLVGVFGLGEFFAFDAPAYARVERVLGDSGSTDADLAGAEDWLRAYADSSWPRHRAAKWFRLSPADARERLTTFRQDREDVRWAEVGKAADLKSRLELVTTYLQDFPGGVYHAEAKRVQSELTQTVGLDPVRDANRSALHRVRQEFNAAKSGRDGKALDEVSKNYFALRSVRDEWHPGDYVEYAALGEELNDVVSATSSNNAHSRDLQGWLKEHQKIRDDMDELKFSEAAARLRAAKQNYPGVNDEIERYTSQFPAEVDAAAGAAVDRAKRTRTYESVVSDLEPALRDNSFLTLTTRPDQDRLRARIEDLRLAWDRSMYGDFLVEPTVDKAIDYLNHAPVKRMKDSVERLTAWNHVVHHPKAMRFEVSSIDWNDWYDHPTVRLRVSVQKPGRGEWTEIYNELTPSLRGGQSGPFTTAEISLIPKDAFRLRITLETEGGTLVFSNRLTGAIEDNFIAVECVNPVVFSFGTPNTTMTFKTVGLAPRPKPEPWRE